MRGRAQTGFTLLELVMVIIALGVLAAIAVPRWSIGDSTVHAQAAQVARDIRHVQMLAMNQGRTLTFESLGTSYRCIDATSTVITDPATQQPFSFTFSDNVTLTVDTVNFDSMGRPVTAGVLDAAPTPLTLSGASQAATLSVTPVTGLVTVTP